MHQCSGLLYHSAPGSSCTLWQHLPSYCRVTAHVTLRPFPRLWSLNLKSLAVLGVSRYIHMLGVGSPSRTSVLLVGVAGLGVKVIISVQDGKFEQQVSQLIFYIYLNVIYKTSIISKLLRFDSPGVIICG